MIDTDVRRGLRVAAARLKVAPPPVPEVAQRGRRRGRGRALSVAGGLLGLLVATGLVGRAVTMDTVDRQAGQAVSRHERAEESSQDPVTGSEQESLLEPIRQRLGYSPPAHAAETTEFDLYTSTWSGAPVEVETPLRPGPRIVKRADLEVEVPAGEFGTIYAEAQRVAAAQGGFVHEAETEGERARSGSLTIRIPSDRFEAALADLKALGLVLHEKVSGQDVTSDFIDLRTRLRNWLAQERAVRGFLAEADTLPETLQIHGQLQEIEVQIEQLKGSLRVLRDRSSLGTVVLELREEGVAAPGRSEEPGTLSRAWHRALAASTEVVAAVVVGLGYLLPILLLLALAWLAFRAVRPRAAA